MSIFNPIHKHIVAAFAATIMFSLPLAAQEVSIDDLFAELQTVPAEESGRIADKIMTLWGDSGSASMDLLLKRGEDALAEGDTQAAIDHLSALVDHAPDFAEGYNARAAAYFEAGYFGPALADIRTALSLNPRHFEAMTGLAVLQEAMEEPEKALETYRGVLELIPSDAEILEAVSRLEGVAL
jgi:Tfp pilus assembly protein PilF